jgi:hypothetical protein
LYFVLVPLDLISTTTLTPSYSTLFVSHTFRIKLYTLLLNLIA